MPRHPDPHTMADEKTTKVTLALRPHVAERLRRMCHAKNTTASNLIDRWVLQHFDEKGDHIVEKSTIEKSIDNARRKLGLD